MWLLDVNIDLGVKEFLITQGISCRTSQEQGWQKLTNGELVRNAFEAQFRVLVTRDKLFNESATTTLRRFSEFAVVLFTMRQQRQSEYMRVFAEQWSQNPIQPVTGKLVIWPPK